MKLIEIPIPIPLSVKTFVDVYENTQILIVYPQMSVKVFRIDLIFPRYHVLETFESILKNNCKMRELFDVSRGNFIETEWRTWFHWTELKVWRFFEHKNTKNIPKFWWSGAALNAVVILGFHTHNKNFEWYLITSKHMSFLKNST